MPSWRAGQLLVDSPYMTRTDTLIEMNDGMPVVIVALAALRIVAAVGLWLGSRRAWVLTMLIVGIGLLFSFVRVLVSATRPTSAWSSTSSSPST